MRESLFYASQEMKRAEHLLYVSLKYTRTGDVIKSLVSRLIACYDFVIDGLLTKEEEEGKIDEIPNTPFAKVTLLKRLYEDDKVMCIYLDYYLLLRKISRSSSEASHEFRRNLVLRVKLDDDGEIEITIDISGDYYHKTHDFLNFIKNIHILDEK